MLRTVASATTILAVLVLGAGPVSAAGVMGRSEADVLEYFKASMPGWTYSGKGYKSLEFANKDRNFVIRVYLNPNATGFQLDSRVETNTPDMYPKTAEGDKVFKKKFHVEEADLKAALSRLAGASGYKLTPMESDEYFSKARETTGSLKTPSGSLNVKDFSVMSLPNEKLRVRTKFSVGQTF